MCANFRRVVNLNINSERVVVVVGAPRAAAAALRLGVVRYGTAACRRFHMSKVIIFVVVIAVVVAQEMCSSAFRKNYN